MILGILMARACLKDPARERACLLCDVSAEEGGWKVAMGGELGPLGTLTLLLSLVNEARAVVRPFCTGQDCNKSCEGR